jgi:hypothetical protein
MSGFSIGTISNTNGNTLIIKSLFSELFLQSIGK